METKMTPDERQLISGLFDRIRSNGPVEKDRDAESLINQAVRQTPDSAYLLVQSVLAQEHYLQQAAGRIEELEARMRDLEDELAQQQAPQRSSGGSFLGGLFGGGQSAPQQPARSAASVPSFGGRGSAAPPQPGSAWNQSRQRDPGYAQGGGSPWGGQQPQQQAPARGGGFMASALTTAAGVAGGMLAANAISGMLGGGSGANAAHHPSGSENSSMNADQQAQLDAQQDAAQDEELANEQYASYDDNSDSDWGGADDSDF
jgi:hypothetical protein